MPDDSPNNKRIANIGLWLALAGLSLLWAQLLWFLRHSWSPESSYNYGWLVPPLALLLLTLRVKEANSIQPLKPSPTRSLLFAAIFVCFLTFVLARLLIEVNPFWRLPLWLGTLSLIAASLATTYIAAGAELLRKAAFPLLFLLTMVPWPAFFERQVINAFTSLVTIVAVESLRVLGHPAEQLGNIIQVGSLSVGVEEACSGIKSLQGLGMIALFIGAFWRLTPLGRISLLLLSAVITVLFNLARSLTLSLLLINEGQGKFDQWHDTIGYTAFGLGLLVLFIAASRIRSIDTPKSAPLKTKAPLIRFPPSTGIAIQLLALAPWAITELWYDDKQSTQDDKVDWVVDVQGAATPSVEIQDLPIHSRIEELLGYDYGYHVAALIPQRSLAVELWHYGYTGESKTNSLGAYGHSPTVCMTASGATLKYRNAPLLVDLGAMEIPFQHFVFRLPDGKTSQVFWCLWDDLYHGETGEIEGRSRTAQFISAFKRQRSFRRKVALLGIQDEDSARARTEIKYLIRELFLLQRNGKTFRFQ